MASQQLTDEAIVAQYAAATSRAYRLFQMNLKIDGQRFDLARYPHIVGIIDDDHPNLVVIKGAQLGLTVAMVLKAIDRAIYNTLRGTLYLFPRDDDVADFSKARFSRILSDNPALAAHIGNTDSIGIKEIGGGFVYFRAAGAKESAKQGSPSKLKSIPIDDLYYDERDDMPDSRVDLADRRLDASQDPHRTELGTPTIPEYGVDEHYHESDEKVFHHKCRRCNGWTAFETTWPDCLGTAETEAFYLCEKCRDPIIITQSEWVAAHPDITERSGYWVSQLNSPEKSPMRIALEWDEAQRKGGSKLREFHNSTLGMPYADEDDALTEQIVRAACGKEPRMPGAEGPCALGADVGPKRIHFQIREKLSDDGARSRVIQWGEVGSFRDVHDLLKRYNVRCAVIDEMAETRSVRKFCEDHMGVAYGCWYSETQKGAYRWDVPKAQVHVNRTESLDASHREIVSREVELPRPDKVFEEEALPSLLNIARIIKENEETGQRTARWIVRGQKVDHLRHAHNYAKIALERIGLADRLRRIRNAGPKKARKGKGRGFMSR